MKALVKYYCDDQNARLAFGLPAEVWRLLHFIIYDHDGTDADSPGEHSRPLGDACQRARMEERSHRLQRKGQEHYIPTEAMKLIVNSRVTDLRERGQLLSEIEQRVSTGEQRHFSPLPASGGAHFFKNEFTRNDTSLWQDNWFEEDGVWPEMTQLAERIASAI